jgi:hypothetical protein
MNTALVIRGTFAHRAFVSDEPMPDVEGPAELIVYPAAASAEKPQGHSMFSVFGTAPRLRSGEDIDAQIAEERDSWNDE